MAEEHKWHIRPLLTKDGLALSRLRNDEVVFLVEDFPHKKQKFTLQVHEIDKGAYKAKTPKGRTAPVETGEDVWVAEIQGKIKKSGKEWKLVFAADDSMKLKGRRRLKVKRTPVKECHPKWFFDLTLLVPSGERVRVLGTWRKIGIPKTAMAGEVGWPEISVSIAEDPSTFLPLRLSHEPWARSARLIKPKITVGTEAGYDHLVIAVSFDPLNPAGILGYETSYLRNGVLWDIAGVIDEHLDYEKMVYTIGVRGHNQRVLRDFARYVDKRTKAGKPMARRHPGYDSRVNWRLALLPVNIGAYRAKALIRAEVPEGRSDDKYWSEYKWPRLITANLRALAKHDLFATMPEDGRVALQDYKYPTLVHALNLACDHYENDEAYHVRGMRPYSVALQLLDAADRMVMEHKKEERLKQVEGIKGLFVSRGAVLTDRDARFLLNLEVRFVREELIGNSMMHVMSKAEEAAVKMRDDPTLASLAEDVRKQLLSKKLADAKEIWAEVSGTRFSASYFGWVIQRASNLLARSASAKKTQDAVLKLLGEGAAGIQSWDKSKAPWEEMLDDTAKGLAVIRDGGAGVILPVVSEVRWAGMRKYIAGVTKEASQVVDQDWSRALFRPQLAKLEQAGVIVDAEGLLKKIESCSQGWGAKLTPPKIKPDYVAEHLPRVMPQHLLDSVQVGVFAFTFAASLLDHSKKDGWQKSLELVKTGADLADLAKTALGYATTGLEKSGEMMNLKRFTLAKAAGWAPVLGAAADLGLAVHAMYTDPYEVGEDSYAKFTQHMVATGIKAVMLGTAAFAALGTLGPVGWAIIALATTADIVLSILTSKEVAGSKEIAMIDAIFKKVGEMSSDHWTKFKSFQGAFDTYKLTKNIEEGSAHKRATYGKILTSIAKHPFKKCSPEMRKKIRAAAKEAMKDLVKPEDKATTVRMVADRYFKNGGVAVVYSTYAKMT